MSDRGEEEWCRSIQTRLPFGGLLKLFILGLINRRGEMSGVEVMRAIEERTGVWKPSPGSVYPALRELEQRGLLASREEGRMRKYYLTPRGREAWGRLRSAQKRIVRDMTDLMDSLKDLLGEPREGIPDEVREAMAELRLALVEVRPGEEETPDVAAAIREAAERIRRMRR